MTIIFMGTDVSAQKKYYVVSFNQAVSREQFDRQNLYLYCIEKTDSSVTVSNSCLVCNYPTNCKGQTFQRCKQRSNSPRDVSQYFAAMQQSAIVVN